MSSEVNDVMLELDDAAVDLERSLDELVNWNEPDGLPALEGALLKVDAAYLKVRSCVASVKEAAGRVK